MMDKRQKYDHENVRYNLAYLERKGKRFEVAIDPDKASAYLDQQDVGINEVCVGDGIFCDTNKGERAKDDDMQDCFGTCDFSDVAKTILEEGHIQFTTEHLAQVKDAQLQELKGLIEKYAVDENDVLLTAEQVEKAFDDVKIKLNETKTPAAQVAETVKKLKKVVPLKMEVKVYEVILPKQYTQKAHYIVRGADIQEEKVQSDGSWRGVVVIPGGHDEQFSERVKVMTHGETQLMLMKTEEV